MRSSFGSTLIFLFIFLVGVGAMLGMLASNTEILRPQQASFETYVAGERWKIEQQRAADELQSARLQRAQALENQRAMGAAMAQVIQQGGIVLVYALAIAIVVLALSSAWRMIVQGIVMLRSHTSRPLSLQIKQVAPAPLPFPDRRPTQRVRKEP